MNMKKAPKILLISSCLLGASALSVGYALSSSPIEAKAAETWGESASSAFISFFEGAVKLNSDLSISTYGDSYAFKLEDQVSSSARHLKIDVYRDGAYAGLLGETSVYADESDNAYLEALSIANEVTSSAIVDSNYDNVSFSENYGGFWTLPSTLSSGNFTSYFSVTSTDVGFSVTPTELGAGYLYTGLSAFLPTIDSSTYDQFSYQEDFLDFVITTDSTGLPNGMSFSFVKYDRYGGTIEDYDVTLSAIDAVTGLVPVTTSLSADDQTWIDDALSSLQAKLNVGNFTQNSAFYVYSSGNFYTTDYNYNCYYELDSDGTKYAPLMLCDFELEDEDNGTTLVGLYESGDVFYTLGISPESDYLAATTSATYSSIEEVVPAPNEISTDFYTLTTDEEGNRTYSFDLYSVAYDDYSFCYDILEALVGVGDYTALYSGIFLYATSTFYFDTLMLTFTSEGELSAIDLVYIYAASSYVLFETTFSNFGTTDISSVDDANIKGCLEVLARYEALEDSSSSEEA